MSQPPNSSTDSSAGSPSERAPPPQWRRPTGVAPGTWNYVNQRSIADHYDAFVADTPLCRLDMQMLADTFPTLEAASAQQNKCAQTVLDLGCGSGRASLVLAQRGYDVVAIDLSSRMLQVTMEKCLRASTSGHVYPMRANLVQLECLADDSADHAICLFSTLGMIQGRANRRRMLCHVARIVRGGGSFLVHVHNRWAALREPSGCRRLANSLFRSWRDSESEFGDATYPYRGLDNMFMHRFSRREILNDLQDAGVSIETVWPIAMEGTHVESTAMIPGGYVIAARIQSLA